MSNIIIWGHALLMAKTFHHIISILSLYGWIVICLIHSFSLLKREKYSDNENNIGQIIGTHHIITITAATQIIKNWVTYLKTRLKERLILVCNYIIAKKRHVFRIYTSLLWQMLQFVDTSQKVISKSRFLDIFSFHISGNGHCLDNFIGQTWCCWNVHMGGSHFFGCNLFVWVYFISSSNFWHMWFNFYQCNF